MKVSSRVALVLSVVVVFSLAGLSVGLNKVLTERFNALEAREVQLSSARLEEILSELMQGPALKIKDWANWDDTVKYVKEKNKSYEESNLIAATLDNVNIDSLRIFDANLDPVFKLDRSRSAELDTLVVSEKSKLFNDPGRKEAKKGFIKIGNDLATFALQPIRPGTGEGEPAGQILMVKFVEKAFLTRASEMFKVPVTSESATQNDSAKATSDVIEHPEGLLSSSAVYLSENEVQIASVVKGTDAPEGLAVFKATLPRPIFWEATKTTQTAFISCLAAFTAALAALMIALRWIVVGRLVTLSQEIKTVGLAKVDGGRVNAKGTDEIASVAGSLNGLLENLEERKAAVSKIVLNVKSGFALVSREGFVEEGYTKYLETLVAKTDLVGSKLSTLLFPPGREMQSFELLYGQLVDDFLPEDMNIAQIPNQCLLGDRWLSISCAVIRDTKGVLEKTLMTLSDITEQKKAELQNADTLATLKILQCKSVFRQFIEEIPAMIEKMKAQILELSHKENQSVSSELRRNMHTLKGNFAMFGLSKLARQIHSLEDKAAFSVLDIEAIENRVREFLNDRVDLLEIKYGERCIEKMNISEAEAADFVGTAKTWKSLGHAQQEMQSFFDRMRCAPAHEVLLPTLEAGRSLVERLGKKAELTLAGGAHRIDQTRIRPILDSLINAIRNAVDHGLEFPHERGNKNETASIVIGVYEAQERLNFYVEDDGKGISWDSLKAVVVKRGLCTEANFGKLTENERMEFLFADSVSTVENATDISGRGLGMGALRDSARGLGGDLTIFSEFGKGTRVELWVPEKQKVARKAS
jgi:sensor domain CHASE-containing protein/HPt (histidine-containing phosphotransfer) domain-containing protein